jgi:SAM-dependent methyltransferase
MTDPEAFYDQLADAYADCTNVQAKTPRAQAFCKRLAEAYRPRRVLDAACGTGLYALAFAQLGLDVTAADLSPRQIRKAQAQARSKGLRLHWQVCAFDALPARAPGPFDLVTCLGNSIVHLLTDSALQAAISAMAAVLAPRGRLLLSLLNYRPILNKQERIVGVSASPKTTFVRFYDFLDQDQLRFNVLTVETQPKPDAQILSTRIRALTFDRLESAIGKAGMQHVQAWGNLQFDPFDSATSDLLVLEARKPPGDCD